MQPLNRPPEELNDVSGAETRPPSSDAKSIVNELEHGEHSHVPVHAIPGTGRKLVIVVLLLAVGLCAAFWYSHHRNAHAQAELAQQTEDDANAPAPVDVVRVGYSAPTHELRLPGIAQGWYQSTIYARVSGYVGRWISDIGEKVTKGQVLALIDTPEMDDQLKAAQARVAADESEVNVAKSNMDFARQSKEMWATSPQGSVSKYQIQQKEADYAAATAQLVTAQSKVNVDQADVARLQDLETFKKVKAPYEGVITGRRIDIGDLVTAGSTASTTPLYEIAQADTIRVFVNVPQWASGEITVGVQATATSEQYPGRSFIGAISRTANAIDPASKTLKVEVDIPNKDLALMPGMYVEVSFQVKDLKPPLRIPAGALNFRTGGPQVAVVDSNKTIHFKPVTIARDLGNYVEIGGGLSSGDLVALNISNQISDGDKVQPNIESDSGGTPQSSIQKTAVAARQT